MLVTAAEAAAQTCWYDYYGANPGICLRRFCCWHPIIGTECGGYRRC